MKVEEPEMSIARGSDVDVKEYEGKGEEEEKVEVRRRNLSRDNHC